MASFSSFGFSGSRSLAGPSLALCGSLAAAVSASGCRVLVGCAAGADAAVRSAVPGASVFRASAFGRGRGAFAARSVAFVRALAASPAPVLLVFPGALCPAGLAPSASSSACFCGLGSGSWASAAFAAGLGVPVVCFGLSPAALPAWGSWVPAPAALAGGFLLSPAPAPSSARQLALF